MLKYENDKPEEMDGPFKDRLKWRGSQDLQDVSIQILNVTYNDAGMYKCHVQRMLEFSFFIHPISIEKNITLKVKEKGAANYFPSSSVLLHPSLFWGLAKCLVCVPVKLSHCWWHKSL